MNSQVVKEIMKFLEDPGITVRLCEAVGVAAFENLYLSFCVGIGECVNAEVVHILGGLLLNGNRSDVKVIGGLHLH